MSIVLVIYHFFTHISEVVFIKMPSRQQQRRAKRRAEYLQNRNEELETSLGFGASKRGRECCEEQNSDDIRASKKQKTNRDSKRSVYWRNPSAARSARRARYQKRKREAETACYNGITTTAQR